MKTIKVTNFKGMEFEGSWNEKTYSSKVKNHPELFRIYVNDESIHITPEEYMRITNSSSEEFEKKRKNDKLASTVKEVSKMSLQEKASIAEELLTPMPSDARLFDIICGHLANSRQIQALAASQDMDVSYLSYIIMNAVVDVVRFTSKETASKELKVYDAEPFNSVVDRLRLYSHEEETYTAKYNNVVLDSKNVSDLAIRRMKRNKEL